MCLSGAGPYYPRGVLQSRSCARGGSTSPSAASRCPGGSPGVAVSLDLEAYDQRRAAMLALLKAAAGVAPFGSWIPVGEAIGRSKSEKLDHYLKSLYELLRDLLILSQGAGRLRNEDIRGELEPIARKVEFAWLRKAVARVDDLAQLVRRNIQKTPALDALIVELRMK